MDEGTKTPVALDYHAPTGHERRAVGGLQLLGGFVVLVGSLPMAMMVANQGWGELLRSIRFTAVFGIVIGCGLFKVAMSFLVKRRVVWAGFGAMAMVGAELALMVIGALSGVSS